VLAPLRIRASLKTTATHGCVGEPAQDKVVVIWTGDLTPMASRTRPPLPGHTVTVAGISIYRVNDGRIVENRSADDLLGVRDQIDPCLL